jgi:hypothetical protein
MKPQVSLLAAIVISLTAFLAGSFIGWSVRDFVKYDACLDRIDYVKSLWHLCDTKEPARDSANPPLRRVQPDR